MHDQETLRLFLYEFTARTPLRMQRIPATDGAHALVKKRTPIAAASKGLLAVIGVAMDTGMS